MIGVELELELEVDAARRRRVPGLAPSRHDRARVSLRRRENTDGRRGRGACAPRSGDGPARRSGRWVLDGHVIKAMAAPDFGRRRPARVAMSRRFRSAQAPSKNVPIVAEPPSVPQAPRLRASFFAPRPPPAKLAVSSSASPVQDSQGAVATYSWGSFGARILDAAKRNNVNVALEKYYANCPLAPLHSSRRGLVAEAVAKRFDTITHPDVIVQDAEVTGHRKRSNTANDYRFGTQSTEAKSSMVQWLKSHHAFSVAFRGIKKELHERCLLVLVKDEVVEIYQFDSRVLPDPMPQGGSPKKWLASKHQRNLITAVSQISSKMREQCRFLGEVPYNDPNYADLFEDCIDRGPINEAYAAFCPLHVVQNTRGVIIEEVVSEVLTDQLSDCKITHIGGSSPFDIKCEIKSNDFYLRWLTTKLDQTLAATVETYVGFLKFEVKTSTIHSDSNDAGRFTLAFTRIEKKEFDKLYLGVCLPTSIEVFLYDGDSGAWTKNSQKGENLIYAAYGTDFGIPRGNKRWGARKNLVDLKTDWQEVWTVLKQKKMNECKHIASIRF